MKDFSLALMTGIDIPIPECQLTVHQPSIKEISMLGENSENKFWDGIRYICVNSLIDEEAGLKLSSFQVFITIMSDKKMLEKKNIILNVLTLLFPKYTINLTPRALLFNYNKETIIIDENNFSSLQEVLRQISCLSEAEGEQYNPANELAADIARKLERGRQRVAAQKQKAEEDHSKFSHYISILSIALHISVNELSNLTIYQLYNTMERYSLWSNWDIDLRARIAGASTGNQPADDWMKIIR